MDVLDHLDKINICTAYEYEGKKITDFPTDISRLEKCKPVYEEVDGWTEDTTGVKSFQKLPKNAKVYLKRIQKIVNTKIILISVGSKRKQTITVE